MLDVELVRCARKTYSTVDEQYIGIVRDGVRCVLTDMVHARIERVI